MKLPQEIKGKNRLRDLKICELYLSGMIPIEIYDVYARRNCPLSLRRIQQIISENATFINPRIGWDKSKRLHRLQRIASKLPDKLSSSKDVLNVLEEIRTEIEGKSALIDQSNHEHVTVIINHPKSNKNGGDQENTESIRANGETGDSSRLINL